MPKLFAAFDFFQFASNSTEFSDGPFVNVNGIIVALAEFFGRVK